MVDPALVRLRKLIDKADGDSVSLAAVRDVLDRAGLGARQKVDLEVSRVSEDRERSTPPRIGGFPHGAPAAVWPLHLRGWMGPVMDGFVMVIGFVNVPVIVGQARRARYPITERTVRLFWG